MVSTASTRVLLNGMPGKLIHNARGLRQGDPLSPMLFILIMEVLHRLLKSATNKEFSMHRPIKQYSTNVLCMQTM